MHPLVLSEFHQSKRGLPWQLLLSLCASAFLQGFLGLPAVLVLLSPTVAAAIGVSTLSEEYSKGQLRFLYSMPISPTGLWCIKVLSGIVGASLFVAVVLLPALFIDRTLIKIPGLDELGFSPGPLISVFAGHAILAYAACLFTLGFCHVFGSVFAHAAKVFGLGRRSFWDVKAYVLEKNGRLARDLFQADQAPFMPAPRQDATDSSMILCWQADVSFLRTDAPENWFLLNLETGTQTPVLRLKGSDRSTYYDYRRSSRDGRSAMGFKTVRQGGRLSYCAFRQDLITSDFGEIPIYEGQGEVTCSYVDDSRVR